MDDEYCIKIQDKTFYDVDYGDRLEYYSDLDFLADELWNNDYKCAKFKVVGRDVLVCVKDDRIKLAYRIKC